MTDKQIGMYILIAKIVSWVLFGLGILLSNSLSLLFIFLGLGLFYTTFDILPKKLEELKQKSK